MKYIDEGGNTRNTPIYCTWEICYAIKMADAVMLHVEGEEYVIDDVLCYTAVRYVILSRDEMSKAAI